MAYDVIQALPIGSVSTNAVYAGLLGARIVQNGVVYRLMKSDTSAITAAQNVFCKFKTGQAASGWVVDAVTGAAAAAGTVAGIPQIPGTAWAANTYAWVARKGRVTGTTAGAVVAGLGLATISTAGAVDDTTVTYDTVVARATDAIASATTGTLDLCLE